MVGCWASQAAFSARYAFIRTSGLSSESCFPGTIDARGAIVIGTIDAKGAIAIGRVDTKSAISTSGCYIAISISRSIWLWEAIDAYSFNGQLRLLIVWPCLWHAEHIGSRFVCSSPLERIRPIRATGKFPICCLRACNGSRSGCKVLLRSQYQCLWKSNGVRPPVAFLISHICAQGKPIDLVKLPIQGCKGKETSSKWRCTSRSACHVTTPKQPWYSFLSISSGARSCYRLVRLDIAVIWLITAASICNHEEYKSPLLFLPPK